MEMPNQIKSNQIKSHDDHEVGDWTSPEWFYSKLLHWTKMEMESWCRIHYLHVIGIHCQNYFDQIWKVILHASIQTIEQVSASQK